MSNTDFELPVTAVAALYDGTVVAHEGAGTQS